MIIIIIIIEIRRQKNVDLIKKRRVNYYFLGTRTGKNVEIETKKVNKLPTNILTNNIT